MSASGLKTDNRCDLSLRPPPSPAQTPGKAGVACCNKRSGLMTIVAPVTNRRLPAELFGGWEMGLIALLLLLYLGGLYVNPAFFGSSDAFHALLRDASRIAVMAV